MAMTKKSILLVDDEESILASVGWALELNKFAVATAANGREAIARLNADRYDLVITDLLMPEVGGLEVLKQAKRLDPDIGVIVLTGYGDMQSAIEAMRYGADDYLQKPCDIDDLIRRSRRSFERQDLFARLRKQNEQLSREIAARKKAEQELEESYSNLERLVDERTAELNQTLSEMSKLVEQLRLQEKELQQANSELAEINTAISVLLKRREAEHSMIREELADKAAKMVVPILKKAQSRTAGETAEYLKTAEANLLDIFVQHSMGPLSTAGLAPRELQVVHYIRQNKTSKEIAQLMGISLRTVEFYRENIRKKLHLTSKRKNLKRFLLSLP